MKKASITGLLLSFLVLSSLTAENRFNRDKQLNIVLDKENSLIWQDMDNANIYTFEEAVKYCKDLEIDSYLNWRIPTIEELESIIDYSRYNPSIKKEFLFSYVIEVEEDKDLQYYWSVDNIAWKSINDTNELIKDDKYAVSFKDGKTWTKDKNLKNFIRCVHNINLDKKEL